VNVTIRHLRAFVTVARLNSFVEASRVLHVTQSALSNVMRELEETIGFRLLDRTTRRVRLSEAGLQYFPYAEKVLAALQEADRCAMDLKNHRSGVVRIASSRLVGWSLMAPVFAEFHRLFPGVRVMPVDVLIEDLRSTIETGQADLAISTRVPEGEHIESHPLFRSKVHIVCTPEHRFAGRESISWHELTGEPLIFVGSHPLLYLKLELGDSFNPSDVYEVGDTTAALGLVAAGIGIAVCPGIVRPATRVHGLRVVVCQEPYVVRHFFLLTNRNRRMLPGAMAYKQFLLDHFGQTGDGCVEDLGDALMSLRYVAAGAEAA
jgi:DNA-binding transcriptional LysR family regulator